MTQASSNLVGTWILKRLEDFEDGRWTRPFGEDPVGYFSFDAAGRISVQFLKNPPPPPFSSDGPSAGEALAAVNAYLCYFGTYVVDEAKGCFTAKVEGALNPALIGTSQLRPFVIEGKTLIVGDQKTYRRFFERA